MSRLSADGAGWLGLIRSSMPPFWSLLAESTGGSVWERDGITAAIVPGSPKRSFFNSVLYTDPEPMVESIGDLATIYSDAGIEAWTVWVPEGDADVAEALRVAGHELDARPRAMAMPIDGLEAPEPDPGLEIREEPDHDLVSRINEVAYGFAPGEFPVMGGGLSALRTYLGSIDGETVACAGAFAHEGDCEIAFVAVLPEGRGRGISGRMVARALADAADQGLETTTLQATKLGYPVYVKLGYADHGELQMWERRK